MISSYLKNEKGATLVIVIVFMMTLLGFMGLVIDVGNLYMERSKMQTAVDMAALAGAYHLPDKSASEGAAEENIKDNKEYPADSAKLSMKIEPYISTGTLAPTTSKFTVTLTKDVPTYIMGIFGIKKIAITVHGTATLEEEGSKYTIYTNKDLEFKGGDIIGNVYSGKTISLPTSDAGDLKIHGDADAGENVFLRDSQVVDKGIKHSPVIVPMPTFPVSNTGETITGTTDITQDQLSSGVKVNASGGEIILDLKNCTSPGVIHVIGTGNVVIKGTAQIIPSTNNPLFIYGSGTGIITLDFSSVQINATIYAPKGKVIMNNGSIDINGYVVADAIEFKVASSAFKVTRPTGGLGHRKITRLIE